MNNQIFCHDYGVEMLVVIENCMLIETTIIPSLVQHSNFTFELNCFINLELEQRYRTLSNNNYLEFRILLVSRIKS
jgi:hypothetical protein